jgi:hypothetical protein
MPPNVLLIVLDAARADHFEPYGAPPGSTPVIADLARAGEHVPYAYSAASWTVPSHAALFSGLLPRAAGMGRAPDRTPQSCRPRMETISERLIAEVFHRAGYETRAASANAWLLPASGFDIGFEQFELVDPSRHLGFGSPGRRNEARAAWEAVRAQVDDGATTAGDLVDGWISEERSRPFFWFVNLVEAHSPYLPPKPFNHLNATNRARAALEARRYLTLDAIWRASLGQLEVPGGVVERMRELYADSVRMLDAWIGDRLSRLDAAGLLGETVVIVTADHGENLGELGMLGHSFSLDERLLRVPLIASGPVSLGAGRLMSLAALAGRLGNAVGIEHPWTEEHPDGVAVAQFDPPTGPDDPRNAELLRLWGVEDPDHALTRRFTSELTCATDGHMKLLRTEGEEAAFDLGADPLEQHPIAPSSIDPKVLERLRSALSSETRAPDLADDGGQATEAEVEGLEERMRLLGYM